MRGAKLKDLGCGPGRLHKKECGQRCRRWEWLGHRAESPRCRAEGRLLLHNSDTGRRTVLEQREEGRGRG